MVNAQQNTVINNHPNPPACFRGVIVRVNVHVIVRMLMCGYSEEEKKGHTASKVIYKIRTCFPKQGTEDGI